MIEPTFAELIERFNIISNALLVSKFNYPHLTILMRMNWEERENPCSILVLNMSK